MLLNCLLATGQLKEGGEYDVDFDHQFIETEKYDAKPTNKKFLGYRPGVAVIGDMIVGIENSDGNTNVRFHQKDTLKRILERLEEKKLTINRFRADCGSCSEDIVDEVRKHCRTFYIRANRCCSLYDDIFALRGWNKGEINGIVFELNSILVEKWKGKPYRLVIQRQRRMGSELDLWEGEYTYRCILTNDYESSMRDIVEFYNMRGGKERIFDDMNNGLGEDGKRSADNSINENVTIHRLYGAVDIDGRTYRVKVTIKEYADANRPKKAYSYEATKIELLAGTLVGGKPSNPSTNNSIIVAKLLEDVESSKERGKKLTA